MLGTKKFWEKIEEEKNWIQKYFVSKKICVKKNFVSKKTLCIKKNVVSKKCLVQKILDPRWFHFQKYIGPKRILGPEKFLAPKMLGLKRFRSKQIWGLKKFWVQINFRSERILGPKKLLASKIMGPSNFSHINCLSLSFPSLLGSGGEGVKTKIEMARLILIYINFKE